MVVLGHLSLVQRVLLGLAQRFLVLELLLVELHAFQLVEVHFVVQGFKLG